MSDYDIPKIDVEASTRSTERKPIKFIHVSEVDVDSVSKLSEVYIYAYSTNKNKIEHLEEVVNSLRENYVLVRGVVFPDWMEDEMDDLTTQMLESVVWLFRIDEEVRKNGLQREQLEIIKEYHE